MCKACTKSIGRAKRKRIGAMPGNDLLMNVAAAVGGGIAAKLSNQLLDKLTFLQSNPAIKDAVKTGAGVMIASYSKDPLLQAFGTGMAVVGGVSLVGGIVPQLAGLPGSGLLQLPGVAGAPGQLLYQEQIRNGAQPEPILRAI